MLSTFGDPSIDIFLPSILTCLILAAGISAALDNYRLNRNVRQRIGRVTLGERSATASHTRTTAASVRRHRAGTMFGEYGGHLLHYIPSLTSLRYHLDCARIQIHVVDFMLYCCLFGLTSFVFLFFYFNLPIGYCIAIASVLFAGCPNILVAHKKNSRRKDFVRYFPDAIDLVVRGVRSGLPVSETILTAGQEIKGAVSDIFQSIYGSIKLGKTLDEALAVAEHSIGVQELKFFRISLSIQQETGGNLGEILSNLSYLMRRREQLKLKIRAMASEARASALIIGSLPFIVFLVLYTLLIPTMSCH